MNNKLTKKELQEPLFITFGRLKTAINVNNDLTRAKLLIEKLDNDLKKVKIEE